MSHTVRRVVIVDDSRTIQAILDNAFSNRRDFQVVGFANDALTAAEMIQRLSPDIVTIDICMPYIDGEALLETIGGLDRVCKIVVSEKAVDNGVLSARLIRAGASACLRKSELLENPNAFFSKINHAADLVAAGKKMGAAAVGVSRTCEGPAAAETSAYPIPVDEHRRIAIGRRRGLFNAIPDRQFDLVTQHTAKISAFPICLLTFIDRDTQWIKSSHGLELESTPRDEAFCAYTIAQGGTFVVANAATDDRFKTFPAVAGEPYVRSYTGQPVTLSDGLNVGALCLIDTRVRHVSKHVLDHLTGMAAIVAEMIDRQAQMAA